MSPVSSLLLLICSLLIYDTEAEDQVRLAGGRTPFEGRVEVKKENGDTWGTVCDDHFDVNDAKVVCRMLGFTNTEYARVKESSNYGAGSGVILLDDTKCQGNESSIFHCNHTTSSDCDHTEDVGVSCQTPVRLQGLSHHAGQVEIQTSYNGSWSYICYDAIDENAGKVLCRILALSTLKVKLSRVTMDTGSTIGKQWKCNGTEADIQNCTPSSKSCTSNLVAALECSTSIRLQNGSNTQSGRVEVFHQGQWGTVCDDSFDDHAASVVCRMLDFSPRQAIALGGSAFGEGTGKTIVDELQCTGEEDDISDCKSKTWGSQNNCQHTEDASVECGTLVRLSDGPLKWSGRLEINKNGIWMAVCDPTFDDNDAFVVCSMLGYNGGTPRARTHAYYGAGTGSHFDYNRQCYGNETDIIKCTEIRASSNCNHSDDVGVNCFSDTPIRFEGGTTPGSGRVEVYDGNKGLWKGVCNAKYGFTQNDAKVLCKMIGHPNENPRILDGSHYHYVIRGEGIAHLNCSGTEYDISDCRSSEQLRNATCDYPDYIGINCDPVTAIRLVDGPSRYAGRVEILFNESWGGICSKTFNDFSSDVNCKMVHKSYVSTRFLDGYYQQTDNVIIDDLHCNGTEADVSDCKASPWATGTCSSIEANAVVCESSVRLVNGSSKRSGIVEVFVDDDWRTICAKDFDNNAADVVCRMSGFKLWNVSVLAGSVSDHLPYIDNIICNGTESSLALCISGPWNKTTCEENLVATIDCNIWHTTIRLVNGENPYSGRIEVFYDNKWGTVCGDSFSQKNAEVVCRTLGINFSTDYSVHKNDYGTVYNNIMINRMLCTGSEVDVSLCISDVWDSGSSNCTSYYSVGVNCLTQVRLVGGTKYMGRVEVQHQLSWGSVCNKQFLKTNIPVLCSMMGFNFTNEYQMIDDVFYTSNTPYPIIENLQCTGEEIDIQQCKSYTWGIVKNCTLTDVAAISCHTPVRLSNGSNIRTGQAEVFKYGRWMSLVYQSYSLARLNAGKVICRILGLSTGSVKTFQIPGNHSNCMNVTCRGVEEDLALCETETLTSACQGMSSLGVTCDTGVSLINGRTPYMGAVQINLMDRWGIIQYFQSKDAARIVCHSLGYDFTNTVQGSSDLRTRSSCKYMNMERLICNGNETDVMECTKSYRNWGQYSSSCYSLYQGVNCQTQIRLSQSVYQHGQVEMQYNKEWYPICSHQFGIEEAHVVCRMLGHYHVEHTAIVTFNNETGNFISGMFSCNGSEVDISQCSTDWQPTNCTNGKVVHVDCRSSVRLVDGPTKYKGRVEVFFKGKWGPVCGINSRVSGNAKVLCKALGFNYNAATVIYPSKYSNAKFNASDLTITNLQCVGSEDDITECKSSVWNSNACYNSEPLEIECNTQVRLVGGSNPSIGYVRIHYNDTYSTVCGDNFTEADAASVCRNAGRETNQSAILYKGNKFGRYGNKVLDKLGCTELEKDIQECYPTPWFKHDTKCNITNTAVSVNCRPNTPIRLVGTSGLVEIHYGHWGRICNYEFDLKDASVVCSMLGYKVGKVREAQYSGTAIIDELRCQGTENDISECSRYNTWYYGRSCRGGLNKMAAVECSNNRVRLMGGVNDYFGRVEFQYVGIWRTVCDTNFDSNDAEVVCRQIGLETDKNAKIYDASRFECCSPRLIVDDLNCQGSESDLDECGSFPWSAGISTCGYRNKGVGVNCRPHTPIRLVNGTSKYTGRVEIEYKGSYGTICDREFDQNDARVVCRNLGYNPWSASFEHHAYYGPGSGNITISHLRCTGDEPDISECLTPYRWGTPYEYCYHGQDVSVQCDTPVRLHGGWTEFDGKVEVFINQTWKPVCKNDFTQNDARAICNIKKFWNNYMLPHTVSIKEESYYNKFNDEHTEAVGNFNCKGDESDLFACGNEWITETYSDFSTVGINCRPITPVRLMNILKETERGNEKVSMTGRVEIMYKDTWGSICDDQFGDEDALVLCGMLNFTVGNVVRGSSYGQSTGPILLDDLRCLGTEEDISDCMAREWGTHNCDHDEDVVISCEQRHRNASGHIDVDISSVISYVLNFTVTYSAGSETADAHGLVTCTNGTELLRFNINQAVTHISLPHLSHGSNYTILAYADERGNAIQLDSTWVITQPDVISYHSDGQTRFRCGFAPSSNTTLYRVKWAIVRTGRDAMFIIRIGPYYNTEALSLSESDLIRDHVYIPFKISCSVGEMVEEGHKAQVYSSYSMYLFAGFDVLTPTIVMHRDETAVVKVSPTIPSSCQTPTLEGGCNLTLAVFVPSREKCSGISTKQCYVIIPGEKGSTGEIAIQASEDGQYGVMEEKTYDLILRVAKPLNSIWENYSVQIKVNVLPESTTYWRGKTCEALNDPHMYTFDGRSYEHHENSKDEFLLYKHSKYDVKIHHKLERCNINAMCNCGVAVQAGRDIYVVSTCSNMLEIGFKQCDDGIILVKQESDTLYSIYLPYGTYVKARVDNTPYMDSAGSMIVSISVFPSVHDLHGRSEGLCGTLDNDPDNDLGDTDGDRINFINKWSVPASESIFSTLSTHGTHWNSPACMCNLEHGNVSETVECVHATDNTCTKGTRVGKQICTLADQRPIGSSLQNKIPVLQLRTTVNQPSYTTPKTVNEHKLVTTAISTTEEQTRTSHALPGQVTEKPHWNESKAKHFCTRYMNLSRVYKLCSRIPFSDTERAIKTCALDVVITQTIYWQRISRATMQEACISEIGRNKTVREEEELPAQSSTPCVGSTLSSPPNSPPYSHRSVQPDNLITTSLPIDIDAISSMNELVRAIEYIACPNECNDQGLCRNGTCKCYDGYGGDTCFIDITQAPSSSTIIHGNVCDESQSSCTHVSIYGGLFSSTTVSCHITSFQTYADVEGKQDMDAYVMHGQAQSLVQVLCPLVPVRYKRSVTSPNHHVNLLSCYRISVSNDGIHHSDPLNMCVFNSKCQILRNYTNGLRTTLIKPGYCYIDGQCISQGTIHVNDVCDPDRSLYQWSGPVYDESSTSPVPTTADPIPHPVQTENNSVSWKTLVIIATLSACVVTVTVVAVNCIRKQRANQVKGKVGQQTDNNEDTLAEGKENEEVYDHINPTDVRDELPHSQIQKHQLGEYESIPADYMKLHGSNTSRSEYDGLHQGEVIQLQNVPPLPSRTSEMPSTDPYTKLTPMGRDGKEYANLRLDGITDSHHLTLRQSEDSEVHDGYETPAPQKIRKY